MTFRPPLRLDQCRNLTVTAQLAHGVVLPPDGWPVPLDGVLESQARRDRLGVRHGDGRDLDVEQQRWLRTAEGDAARRDGRRPGWLADADRQTRRPGLPLAVWGHRRPQLGRQWVWLASCARWPEDVETDTRWWHRRFRDVRAEQVVDRLPAMVYATHGPYRSYRVPLSVTLVSVLTWRVVGDLEPLLDLCRRVGQLGQKVAQGEGRVLRWDVVDEGPADPAWALWTPDGYIGRPVPARAAAHLGVEDAAVVPGCVRPPYWRPPDSSGVLGEFGRQWRDVLAPDTRRPG